jgi:peptidoglycan hydrolase CwlO-like protein
MKLRDTWIRLLKSIILFSALVVIFYSGVIFSSNLKTVVEKRTQARYIEATREFTDDIAMTRNELSRQLNEMSKKIGKLQCEVG